MKSIPSTYPAALTQIRGGLGNTLEKLRAGQPVSIAYFGTSISNSKWGPNNADWFRKQFPDAEIHEIKAAIGATGSELGVFRVCDHVLKHKPDLVFVEFSINDDGRPQADICRVVEGIVRQIWKADPRVDICLIHMFRPNYTAALKAGKCTPSQSAHEAAACLRQLHDAVEGRVSIKDILVTGKTAKLPGDLAKQQPTRRHKYSVAKLAWRTTFKIPISQ